MEDRSLSRSECYATHRTGGVDAYDTVPYRLGRRGHSVELVHDARVVDEDVETPELLGDALDEGLDFGLVGDVRPGDEDPTLVRLPLLLDLVEPLLVHVADGDLAAGVEERLGDRLAKSPSCAGDGNCDLREWLATRHDGDGAQMESEVDK